MVNVPELFGSNVFNDDVMKDKLPKPVYKALKKTIQEGASLDDSLANAVAHAMKEWAIEKGCTHYTHWFQPLTGVTAEKHDSFITPDGDGKVMMTFSGKELIKGEPDASSFPSGGIRATFEARGYTAWDPTSPAFAKDGTLYIPTAFCSYKGEVLDKKTPLLRSMETLSKEAVRVLHLLGKTEVNRVITTVGPEQEYFLIDKKMYDARPDLIFTGRTLFGAPAPKGQELDDHYFGSIKTRVSEFMAELDKELWSYGIYAKTEHNEVAPSQHEVAPIYTTTNVAVDNNELLMEILKKTAEKFDLVCLLHEKPFAGVNGSGKHNNWSISTNTGENLLKPGKNPSENVQFLVFLAAIVKAVDEYQDLLRISVASAGNDHRLGANEAPPAILSVFLGDDLGAVVDSIEIGEEHESEGKKNMDLGVEVLPTVRKDTTDRNRTSPFAFTGNRFEFRMLGSAANIASANIIINTIVAESLKEFADRLETVKDVKSAAKRLVVRTFKKHDRIIFNGDNYSDWWVEEAERRGLYNLRSVPDAIKHYIDKKNVELFKKNDVFTFEELEARYEVELENYVKLINIEALTMLDMSKKDIIPAVTKYVKKLTDTALAKQSLSPDIPTSLERELIIDLSKQLVSFSECIKKLEDDLAKASEYSDDNQACADFYCYTIIEDMEKLRKIGDSMETQTASKYWPYPSYGEMLFGV
ncbi:MAG: glutamine synthetase III [Ruminococcus sp.]|nr:glutamine synthetase III [Ruminococcus sp.]